MRSGSITWDSDTACWSRRARSQKWIFWHGLGLKGRRSREVEATKDLEKIGKSL